MKKLVLLLAVVFSVSLISCTEKAENATEAVDSVATEAVEAVDSTAAAAVDSAAATVAEAADSVKAAAENVAK